MQEIMNAVVIDDDKDHIYEITKALSEKGISTIPIHYIDPTSTYKKCAEVGKLTAPRVIITDIQMRDQGGIPTTVDLTNVARCLLEIVQNTAGPYIILAWTSVPSSFNDLKKRVEVIFTKRGVRHPFYFDSICKNECRSEGKSFNTKEIFKKFSEHLENQKQIKALLQWERSVLQAAMYSVNELVGEEEDNLEKTLYALAQQVAGSNLADNESVAVNEALLYVLKDKISHLSLEGSNKKIWKEALQNGGGAKISDEQKAKLNSILHFDENVDYPMICPGDIWKINKPKEIFNLMTKTTLSNDLIQIFKDDLISWDEKGYELQNKIRNARKETTKKGYKDTLKMKYSDPTKKIKHEIQPMLMEISPACDFSNNKKKVKTLILGALIPTAGLTKEVMVKSSEAIISCPVYFKDKEYFFVVSSKFIISLSDKKICDDELKLNKILRMRESMLQSWIHKISSHNSRIGTVSFH